MYHCYSSAVKSSYTSPTSHPLCLSKMGSETILWDPNEQVEVPELSCLSHPHKRQGWCFPVTRLLLIPFPKLVSLTLFLKWQHHVKSASDSLIPPQSAHPSPWPALVLMAPVKNKGIFLISPHPPPTSYSFKNKFFPPSTSKLRGKEKQRVSSILKADENKLLVSLSVIYQNLIQKWTSPGLSLDFKDKPERASEVFFENAPEVARRWIC